MFIVAILPTYRRAALVANCLWLWERQDYPADQRFLMILDDGGTFSGDQEGPNWRLVARDNRCPSFMGKHRELMRLAPQADAVALWNDDDIYLPGYLSAHAACLEQHPLSKPSHVLSDYTGKLEVEVAGDRFWSSMALRTELLERAGGWPLSARADCDQLAVSEFTRLAGEGGRGSPWGAEGPHEWIYGWHTGYPHGQASIANPDDPGWYDRAGRANPKAAEKVVLEPKRDARTAQRLAELAAR